jgi:hypothetical protein
MMEFLSWLEQTEFCTWIRDSGSIWAYPLVLTLHTTGMGVLVGFNWAVDLRLLNVGKQIPVPSMERFFPIMWVGFWVNLLTGLVLLAADATTKLTSWVFGVKMLFIILAMIVLLKLDKIVKNWPRPDVRLDSEYSSSTVSGTKGSVVAVAERTTVQQAAAALPNAKLFAILSLLFWTLSITAGRLMAYLGPVSGLNDK